MEELCPWHRAAEEPAKLQGGTTTTAEQAEHNLQHKANSPSTLKATSERENNRWETADCRNRAGKEKRAAFTA